MTIKTFIYNTGNDGMMAITDSGREFNLTVNDLATDQYQHGMLLKFWGDAEQINRNLLKDMVEKGIWKKEKVVHVGINNAVFVTIINKNKL